MHLAGLIGAVTEEPLSARRPVDECGNVLFGRESGRSMEADRRHAWLPYSIATLVDQDSVQGLVILPDKDAVALPADFQPARMIGRRENHTLARRKNRHDADRRSGLTLRERCDDVKPIPLDRVVSDARGLPKVDALGLDRTQTIGAGSPQGGQGECSSEKNVAD